MPISPRKDCVVFRIARARLFLLFGAVYCGVAAGVFRYDWNDRVGRSNALDEKVGSVVEIRGVIRDEPDERDTMTRLVVEADAIRDILKNVPGKTQLIMENTAGGGNKLGDFDDLAFLFHAARSSRVKVCFDTAHAFEAGLVSAYSPEEVRALAAKMDAAFGIENLVAIHANDSRTLQGSHHDQHGNIGEGHIGMDGFRALAREKKLWKAAWLLEVPGFSGAGTDAKNIERLKSCFV